MPDIALTDEEVWMVYDLVAQRTEQLEAAELECRTGFGGEAWRMLRRKLRAKTVAPEAPVA